jgi:hypothetical protein
VREKGVSPTRGFVASPEVGAGATVGTLQTRYPPRTSCKSRRRAGRALTRVHMSMTSAYATHPARAARVPPHLPWCQLPPPGSGQLGCRHVSHGPSLSPDSGKLRCCHAARGAGSRILAQGSSGAATCPMELYKLWAIEVNKYPLVALPS